MISQLIQKIQKTKAPICVGLDPMLGSIPNHIVQRAFKDFGETMEGAAEAVWQFNKEIIDNTYDLIPSVKPQIAMYEQFGIEGLKIYARTIEYCQNKGLLVIGDVKRGDIGSTSSAYAVGHIGSVKVGSNECRGFNTDFITVNPYLGTDGIKPFVNVCNDEDRGLFVLVKTSNPSSGEFQDRLVDGRPLYELVAEKVVEWGEASMDGDYISGDEQDLKKAHAEDILPCTGLRRTGRYRERLNALFQRGWSRSCRKLLQRNHRCVQAGEIRKVRSGTFRRGIQTGRCGYDRGYQLRIIIVH